MQRGLGKTIYLWFIVLSFVPLMSASIISYLTASNILREEALKSLNSISQLKKEYINNFFNERINDLQLYSQLSSSLNGLRGLLEDFNKSGLPAKDYVGTMGYDMYTLDLSLDLDNFRDTYKYEDVYLLDLQGNVLFTALDEDIRGSNLFSSIYAETLLGRTCKNAINNPKPHFSDIEFLPDRENEAASFLVQLMKDEKSKVGIMVIRIPLGKINQIMKSNTERSATGETFLVGEDLYMRSESRLEEESTVLVRKVETNGTKAWKKQLEEKPPAPIKMKESPQPSGESKVAGDSKDTKAVDAAAVVSDRKVSIADYRNHRQEDVLGVYYNLESLQKLGVKWGLIAEIKESEAFGSANTLMYYAVGIMLITILFVTLLSLLVARRIVEPIRRLSNWAKRVAIGDLSYEQITSEKNEIGEMNTSFKEVVDSFQAVTDVCETIALGDFSKTVAIRSEKDALGRVVNQMKDNLVEVVRRADNISSGDYSGEVVPRSDKDMLGIALDRMTRTLREAATVAEEVSVGDYSLKMEIKGEKDMLGKALNQMIEKLKESNDDSRRKIDYLNNIPTPVHVIDQNFDVQFINKAGAMISGRTVDECIGKKCYALFNTSHCRTEKCRAYRAMNQDKVLTGDTVAIMPGQEIPMRYTSAPLKDIDGKIIGAIEYMVDISDEMQVVELAEKISRGDYSVNVEKRSDEDRLSDALNRMTFSLREAVEQNQRQNWLKSGQSELNNRMRGELDIPDLCRNIINYLTNYLDAQLGLLYFVENHDTLKLVGSYALGKEKSIVKKFKFGEGVIGQAALQNETIIISDIPEEFIKVKTGFGEIYPRNIIAVPFSYESHVVGVIEIASIYSIHEIQKEFLMQSLENIGIALNSAESRRQLTELLEKTQEQAEKLQAQQEELRQSNEELEGQTKALIASETNLQSQQEELRVINEELEERTRALEKQKADIQLKNKELLHARNEIAKKARDLEEVSKYKSEFLANMSHELRTPLNSILILSQLLSNNSDVNLSEKQVEFARTIHSSGSDLLALINEILDLSKIEAGMMEIRIEKFLLEDFSGNINRVFRPVAANKGLEFILDIKKTEVPEFIYTDAQRAQQVIKNLVSNAFKFTDEGSVTFSIYRPDANTELLQSGLKPEEALAFEVRDTGIGIPADKQTIIFEAFRQEDGTTSRKYGGTGLGLSISRELALLLGGEIRMKSEKNKGSMFTLFLPEKLERPGKRRLFGEEAISPLIYENGDETAAAEEPDNRIYYEQPETPLKSTPPPNQEREVRDDRKDVKPGDKSLLIIEDDPNFSEVLLNLSQARGFKAILAEDGETGLHFADFYKPSAIILDIGLPGINGWEVMDRLKRNPDTRHIPVHFMSAADDNREALKMGAIGYLSKPVKTETIDEAFGKIEGMLNKPVKKLLVVDNNNAERQSIIELMGSGDVETDAVTSGKEALELMEKNQYDTMVFNPNLDDMPGLQILEKIKNHRSIAELPIIIYTEKKPSQRDMEMLEEYSRKITIKDVHSPDRLFTEATLFLHRVESDLPESKQRILKRMIDKKDTLSGKKILVVDDDMRNVFALTSILEDNGMITVVGKNGKEGLDKLNEDSEIDLVLMDIMMPVMDGYEAMHAIRKNKRFDKLPLIALTAKAMKGDRSKCVSAGASDYLAKPVDAAKLLSLLRVWLYQA